MKNREKAFSESQLLAHGHCVQTFPIIACILQLVDVYMIT